MTIITVRTRVSREAMPFDHVVDDYGRSQLLLAVRARDLEKARRLVASGADVNEIYKPKKNDKDDYDTLKMDVNASERWGCSYYSMYSGMTALSVASYYGPFEMVKFLVESGADLHPLSYWRRNCLHWAIEGDDFEIVEYLLSQNKLDINVDIGLTEPKGCNPLYLAIWSISFSEKPTTIVKLLLDHGAIVSDSSYELVLDSKRPDLVKLLLTKYNPPVLGNFRHGCVCF